MHANCGFKYSIPPTKFITNPFVRPAKADFLFGYTYSGYATLQKAVDDFILTNASTQGPVTTTVRTRITSHTPWSTDTPAPLPPLSLQTTKLTHHTTPHHTNTFFARSPWASSRSRPSTRTTS